MNLGVISKCHLIAKNKPALVKKLLQFFGVVEPEDWQKYYAGMEIAFRRTRFEQSDVGAITAWLRLGEIEAEKLDCPKYSKSKFEKAVRSIRTLTGYHQRNLNHRCNSCAGKRGLCLLLYHQLSDAEAATM